VVAEYVVACAEKRGGWRSFDDLNIRVIAVLQIRHRHVFARWSACDLHISNQGFEQSEVSRAAGGVPRRGLDDG